MDSKKNEVKNRLEEVIKSLGYSIPQMASILGISSSCLGGWLSGRLSVPVYLGSILYQRLNISVEWWEYGKGEMFYSVRRDVYG